MSTLDTHIRRLQAKREREHKQREAELEERSSQYATRVGSIAVKYEAKRETFAEQLSAETVGLQSLEAFRSKKTKLMATGVTSAELIAQSKKDVEREKRVKVSAKKLSFDIDDEEAEDHSPKSPKTTGGRRLAGGGSGDGRGGSGDGRGGSGGVVPVPSGVEGLAPPGE